MLCFAVLYHRCVVISIFYLFAADCKQVCELWNIHTQTRLFMTYNRKTNIRRRIILTLQLVEHREWCFRFSLASNVREVSSAKKYSSTNILYQKKSFWIFDKKWFFHFIVFFLNLKFEYLTCRSVSGFVGFQSLSQLHWKSIEWHQRDALFCYKFVPVSNNVNKCWLRWYNVDDSFPYHRLMK